MAHPGSSLSSAAIMLACVCVILATILPGGYAGLKKNKDPKGLVDGYRLERPVRSILGKGHKNRDGLVDGHRRQIVPLQDVAAMRGESDVVISGLRKNLHGRLGAMHVFR